ncbi:hypothetical protein GCM10010464_07230 [Pseudonocardia yunnanensis]
MCSLRPWTSSQEHSDVIIGAVRIYRYRRRAVFARQSAEPGRRQRVGAQDAEAWLHVETRSPPGVGQRARTRWRAHCAGPCREGAGCAGVARAFAVLTAPTRVSCN